MAVPDKIDLGAFPEGSVPPDLEHTYTDFAGNPVDISTFVTLQMNIESQPPSAGLGSGPVTFVSDGSDGKVKYVWQAADMAKAGDYEAQVWVSDGTKKLPSDLLVYSVYDGPGQAP